MIGAKKKPPTTPAQERAAYSLGLLDEALEEWRQQLRAWLGQAGLPVSPSHSFRDLISQNLALIDGAETLREILRQEAAS